MTKKGAVPPMLLTLHPASPPREIEGAALYTVEPGCKQCKRLVRASSPDLLKARAMRGPNGAVVCPGCNWCCRLPEGVEAGTEIWVAVEGSDVEPDPRGCRCIRMA
mgnify:FL=1